MAGRREPDFDVVVVGAGPAGARAARAAALAGARVCVLERAALPRYKTCGGGLVGLSVDHAGIDLAPLVRGEVDTATFTLDGRAEFTRHRPGRSRDRGRGEAHGPGRALVSMVMRADFDAALVDAAQVVGAEVRTGAHVTALTEDVDGVTVTVRGGDPVRAGVVVGADGTSGRTGAYVGVRCNQVDVGLEGEYPAPPGLAQAWAGRMLLDWGPVPGSYAWLFPKVAGVAGAAGPPGGVLTVGVIGDRRHGEALRAYYRRVVARLGLDGVAPLHDSGHLTRVRAPGSPLRRGRVILAGDAAGLLDPWTREGISFALRSGRLAGEAAAHAAAGDFAALERYPAQVEAVFGAEVDAGRAVFAAFARRPAVMHAFLAGAPGAFGLFTRVIEGRSTVARQLRRPGVRAAVAALAG